MKKKKFLKKRVLFIHLFIGDKVTLYFLATGNAPILKKKKFAISATSTFKEVIKFLREKVLKLKSSDTLV